MTNSNYFQQEYRGQLAQDRYGLMIAARLSDASGSLPHDISERLRAARTQAVSKRKIATARTASSTSASDSPVTMTLGDEHFSLWDRIASAIPLIALIVGLVSITMIQNDNRAREIAEVDAALLTDDLPTAAFTDPGFIQFLKARRDPSQ